MLSKLRTLSGTAALALVMVGCGQNNFESVATKATDSSIIGGADATGTEDFSKTIVALYNLREGFICTASILSNDILLTAAHCMTGSPSDTVVIFDKDAIGTLKAVLQPIMEKNGSLDDVPATAPLRRVTDFRVSPIWPVKQNDLLNTGDIAVVKFKGGLAAGFERAAMLTSTESLANGQTVLLSGYGTSDGVKGTGSGLLRFVETTIKKVDYTKTEILIEQSLGKGACHGDSGGPAYAVVDGKKYLIGVTSRGVDDLKNDCSVSAAYTGVAFYAGWVIKAVKEMNTSTSDKVLPLPAPSKEAKPTQKVADAS